jgi:UDPglucose 6-dehydrogenase
MIGFAGLSHLGLNYSLATAAKGFEVVCFDPDAALVARLEQAAFPIEEPGFTELFAVNRQRIHFTSDPSELSQCGLLFFALDVRTNERNESDHTPLRALIATVAPSIAPGATAVVLSQVPPGFMRELVATTASAAGAWFYQVETLIFGAAVQRAMEPERYIIGATDPKVDLPAAYQAWLKAFDCPLLVMRLESAELAKIAINFFLVSSVTTSNTLAEVCEKIGADWSEIAPALRLDRRIGPHAYLKPGLGVAGGNLERDLVTVQSLANRHGTEAGIISAWQHNSVYAKAWALRTLKREVLAKLPSAQIAVWGLAYKQDTHSIKNSAAIELVQALPACNLQGYDPQAHVDLGAFPNLQVHSSAEATLPGADALVIMTPWMEFSQSSPLKVRSALKGSIVIDPYGMLDADACAAAGLRHFQIGRPA